MMTATQAWLEYKYNLKSPTDETVCVPFSIYDIPKHMPLGMKVAVPCDSTIAETLDRAADEVLMRAGFLGSPMKRGVFQRTIIICDQCRAQCRDGDKYCSNCGFCLRCD